MAADLAQFCNGLQNMNLAGGQTFLFDPFPNLFMKQSPVSLVKLALFFPKAYVMIDFRFLRQIGGDLFLRAPQEERTQTLGENLRGFTG